MLSETNSVGDERLESGTTHAESPDTAEAWGLDSNQQCQDEKTGKYIQFISSLSCDPVRIYKNTPVILANVSLISSQTEDQEMVYTDEGRNKDGRLLWIGVSVAMLTLTICIVFLLILMKGN